ncbi:MAG: protein kinase [Acidimicrobiia bacterium]
MPDRPTGAVTFLFTDIEGSTALWEKHRESMQTALREHDRLLRSAMESHGGYVFSTAGDAFSIAFQDPTAAVEAALTSQLALQAADFGDVGRVRVRMAIHSGTAEERDGDYFGPTLNRCARILAIASGDEVLISLATRQLLDGRLADGIRLDDIGEFRLKDLGRSDHVFRLGHDDLLDRASSGAPQRIRGHEVVEIIGEGGFGIVYRARQEGVEREVAVKAVRPEFANNPDFIRRFDTEAQLVARLEHPFIVPLYDYWREPNGAFLVMRWLRGGSLASVLSDEPWGVDATLRLLRQVGDALAVAHRSDVIHRDIKPANILLDVDGNAYLSDFGIAADIATSMQIDALDESSYWPAYASPEQLRHGPATRQGDIYSLGLVVYELLTGRYPFGGNRPSQLLERQLNDDLPDPAERRPELPAELSRVIGRATSRDPLERYRDVTQFVRDFELAVSATPLLEVPSVAVSRNPYKGLAAFQQSDAGDFYGRQVLRNQIIELMSEQRLVAVVGPSGSGKSSVVKAGVLPAIQGGAGKGWEDWFFTEMVPGTAPFEELEAALLRVAVDPPATLLEQLRQDPAGLGRVVAQILPEGDQELVLVIDQFEEVFSLVTDASVRQMFLKSLLNATAGNGRLRVILTLRADFFDQPLLHPEFAEALKAGLVTVTPLSAEELEEAIVEPGRQTGISFEPGLVGDIVTDVTDQPGALPLLQYALTQLVEQRDAPTLTRASYRRLGGVAGALGLRAEEIFETLDRAGQEAARQVFLRLVSLGEGTGDTRRRVLQVELNALSTDEDAIASALAAYGGQRLLAFDRDPATRQPTVEVAHEALLREWNRLRDWIDVSRADLRLQRSLTVAAGEWDEAGRDQSFLLSGARLERVAAWATSASLALTVDEAGFIEASLSRRKDEEEAERERQAREDKLERRSVLRLRALVGAMSVAAVVAIGLSLFAFNQRSEARTQARLATAQGLAVSAVAVLESDPEQSLELALAGARLSTDAGDPVIPEVEDALHRSLQAVRATFTATDSTAGAFSPDGGEFILATGVDAVIYTAPGGAEVVRFQGHQERVTDADLSSDGILAATAGEDGSVRIWDVESGLFLRRFQGHPGGTFGVEFSPDATMLATIGLDNAVRVWDVASGEQVTAFQSLDGVASVDWHPNSKILGISGGQVVLIDVTTEERIAQIDDVNQLGSCGLAFNPQGDTLAVGRFDGSVPLWSFSEGSLSDEPSVVFSGHSDVVCGLDFSSDGALLATAGDDSRVLVRNVETGTVSVAVPGHRAGVFGVMFSPDGRSVLSVGEDLVIKLSDISPSGSRDLLTLETEERLLNSLQLSPDGTRLAAGGPQSPHLWDVSDPDRAVELELPAQLSRDDLHGGEMSEDWSRAIGFLSDGSIALWDSETWEEISRIRTLLTAASADASLIATVGASQTEIWDGDSGELIRSWPTDLGDFPSGALVASFNSDATLLAVASPFGRIKVSEVATGRVVLEDAIPGDPGGRDLVFASDGSWLALAAGDASIRRWDLSTGEPLGEVLFHSGDLTTLALSRDDEVLASASTDGTIRIWQLSTDAVPLTLTGHTRGVSGLAFGPSGDRLFTSGLDGTVRIYALDIDDLMSLAELRLAGS